MHNRDTYITRGDITVTRSVSEIDYATAIETFSKKLDTHRGCLLSSSYEYPNRYKRWDLGIVDPMLVFSSRGYDVLIEALNERGRLLLPVIQQAIIMQADFLEKLTAEPDKIVLTVAQTNERLSLIHI